MHQRLIFKGKRNVVLYDGEKKIGIRSVAPSMLIGPSSNLYVTRTNIKFMSISKYDHVGPFPLDLIALCQARNPARKTQYLQSHLPLVAEKNELVRGLARL